MMLAPTGIVIGPKRLYAWWMKFVDWYEARLFPSAQAYRRKSIQQQEESTRLQRWLDEQFP